MRSMIVSLLLLSASPLAAQPETPPLNDFEKLLLVRSQPARTACISHASREQPLHASAQYGAVSPLTGTLLP